MSPIDLTQFISANTRLGPVYGMPDVCIHQAHPGSGLRRLPGAQATPYWAYAWPGGIALARYVLDHPDRVAGRRILDLGAGSGLVAIAAMRAGAAYALAADIDPHAVAAARLNAAANQVSTETIMADLTLDEPPAVDLILVADLFYERALARRVFAFLQRSHAVGITALIGDIGRAYLSRRHLTPLAEYHVPEFGEAATATAPGTVYAFVPPRPAGSSRSTPPRRSPRPSPESRPL